MKKKNCCDKLKMKGGKNMEINKRAMLWGIIGILLVATIFLTFKVSSAGTGQVTGAIDTSGWTQNEIMNYQMHGIVPARAQSGGNVPSTPGGSGMVGGC